MAKFNLDDAIKAAVANALVEQAMRIEAILTAPEADGREAMARKFALSTNLSVESVIELLGAAPKANGNRDLWLAAMSKEGPLGLAPEHTTIAQDAKSKREAELKRAAAHVSATKYGKRVKA